MAELGKPIKCLYIKSNLSERGVDEQMAYITNKFKIDLNVVDRSNWLKNQLKGKDFFSLENDKRKYICRNLKREPLLDFIKKNSFKIWISGIRRDQTDARGKVRFMSVTDLSVIKLSPLFEWSKEEVKNLIIENNLRVNVDHYDLCKLNESKECGLHF